MNPTNHIAHSINKPVLEPLGMPHLQILQQASQWAFRCTVHLTHTHLHLMVSSLYSKSKSYRLLVSMQRKPVQHCGTEINHTTFSILHHSRGSKPLQDQEKSYKSYKLKKSPIRGDKKCGTGISIEKTLRKPQNPYHG